MIGLVTLTIVTLLPSPAGVIQTTFSPPIRHRCQRLEFSAVDPARYAIDQVLNNRIDALEAPPPALL